MSCLANLGIKEGAQPSLIALIAEPQPHYRNGDPSLKLGFKEDDS